MLFILVFGYITVYAKLKVTGYEHSELAKIYKEEKRKNDKLNIKYTKLYNPDRIIGQAENAGMVYADNFDYVSPSDTVAGVYEIRP